MPRLGDHIQRVTPVQDANEQQLYEGRVANTPSAPGDEVYVTIRAFDEEKHRHGPVVWHPEVTVVAGKAELVMPEKGDLCLVAKPSTTGSVWLLAWR